MYFCPLKEVTGLGFSVPLAEGLCLLEHSWHPLGGLEALAAAPRTPALRGPLSLQHPPGGLGQVS